jgi:hypothetical protein
MWECDGTVIITNANENEDINQKCSLKFDSSFPVQSISGDIAVHQYFIGKSERNGRSFWFHINGQDPTRTVKLTFTCPARPDVSCVPKGAITNGQWNPLSRQLEMTISYASRAAEIELKNP